ncbi:MAG: 2-dehydropantoate 2-reductase [Anaerolineae bacterium]
MKIAVIGAGAMGSLFGGKLSPYADVWLVDPWASHVQTLQRDGLRLTELDGTESIIPVQATTDSAAVGGGVDLVIIFVKSHQTAEAAQWARPLLKPDGLALTLQNGLGNLQTISNMLGEARAVQGVTSHGATLLGPGGVRHAGQGPTHIAIQPSIAERLNAVAALFRQAGFEIHLSNNLDGLLWGKLVINVGINPLTAILRVPNGVLAELEPASALMAATVDEAVRVAHAKGIALPYDDPQGQVKAVAVATGSNCSSMLSDVLRGVPTEIDVINGTIVREGTRLGIPTPVNQTLVWLIKAIEASYVLAQ